jgi:CheY-like chemotaxis protein
MTKPLALIIEDDTKQGAIFAAALQKDFEVEVLEDGQQAIERLNLLTPALIILDLHLPHMSGAKVLNYIRSSPRLAHIRVMLATADAMLADQIKEEADLILLKPISVSQLRELAARLV